MIGDSKNVPVVISLPVVGDSKNTKHMIRYCKHDYDWYETEKVYGVGWGMLWFPVI